MKKYFILPIAACLTLMSTAAVPQMPQKYAAHRNVSSLERIDRTERLSRDGGVVDIQVSEDVITEPQGQAKTYMLKSLNFEVDFMGGLVLRNEMTEAQIVWGDDGLAYIKDIMLGLPANGVYVEGEYTPSDNGDVTGTITVELPQVCAALEYDEGEMSYPLATLMELTLDNNEYVVATNVVPDANVVYYDVYADGTVKLRLNDGDPTDPSVLPHYVIGMVEEYVPGQDTWSGYGVAYAEYGSMPYQVNTIPEGVELDTWAIISNSGNKIIEVGFDDNTFYMKGFSQLLPDAVVRATVDGDKLQMDFPQYLGSLDGMMLFFQGIEWDSEFFITPTPIDHLTLNYDAAARRITVDNPLVDFGVCFGGEMDALWEYYEDAVITWLDPALVNAAPLAPRVDYYSPYEYRDWYECYEGYIDWVIPTINVNDQPLDPERMYYNLYVDGELWTLTVDDYPDFEEDVTDIPYDFGDDYDLQVLDESHYLTFKFDGAQTFGCQSYFLGTDGEVYASGISTYDVETGELTGIETTVAQCPIVAVVYYNLQGQRVNNPHGATIVKITYADGTIKSSKTFKK